MILVTGATGFLGSELVRQLLSKGEKVRALRRSESRIPELLRDADGVEWVYGDMLDQFSLEEAVSGVDEIYHCAAFISFRAAERRKMMNINVEGTARLVNIALAEGVRKFVHVSSVAAIGDSPDDRPVDEDIHFDYAGASGYAVSKYESEMEVFRAVAEGLNAVIVNPSIIIGQNCGPTGSGQLFETIRKGMAYYPSGSFGYVDVEDVAKAMISLMKSDYSGERFILNSENRTHQEFFSEVALAFGKRPPAIKVRPWMLQIAGVLAWILSGITGKKYGLTKDTIRSAFSTRNYSNDKVKKALNLQFKPIHDSVVDICRSFS